jgi:putative membrane protein
VDALGGCERISKTPMPFGYLAQQRIFMLLWLVTYPLAIASAYKWWTIPVTAGVSFIMCGRRTPRPPTQSASPAAPACATAPPLLPLLRPRSLATPLPSSPPPRLKLDAIGVEIEHPFGASPHDLPLEHICITIEKNLLEILRRAESRELRLVEGVTPPRRRV